MIDNVKIKIICRHPKEFVDELIKKRINIYDISIYEKHIEIIINKHDIEIVDKIKLIHKLEIVDYYGISKFKYLLLKYKTLIIFILIGIFINIILSNIIFFIKVDTSNKEINKIVLNDLKELGLKKYNFKCSKKRINNIKNRIMKKENKRIEWIEIENYGTKYIIRIQERKIDKEDNKCYPRNIISKKNALITKINSSSGEIMRKKNDYVEKGELLISGLIHNKDEIVAKKCSVGRVYGEVWYNVSLEIPKEYKVLKKYDNHSYGISINLLSRSININHKFISYEKNEYNIVESNLLPLSFNFTKYNKMTKEKYYFNKKNVDDFAINMAIKTITKKYKSKVNVMKKKVLKKTSKNSKIKVDVFLAIEEDITDYQDISDINIEEMNKEKE